MSDDETGLSIEDLFHKLNPEQDTKTTQKTPYKFLDPYEKEDSDIFFGREDENRELFQKFYTYPYLLVYGESGTGKTSLLRCGLLSRIPDSDVLVIHVKNSGNANATLNKEFETLLGAAETHLSFKERIRLLYKKYHKPVAVILDQLEELFVLQSEAERSEFIANVASWVELDVELTVLFVIREEYLAKISEFEAFFPDLFQHRIWIKKMDHFRIKDILIRPLQVFDMEIEPEVVELILNHFRTFQEGIGLPDLQVLLDRLYQEALKKSDQPPKITRLDFERLGDLNRVLSEFLEKSISLLDNPDEARSLLKQMITPEGTKKQISVEMMNSSKTIQPEKLAHIIKVFEDRRIIRFIPDNECYELRHDSLARIVHSWLTAVEKDIIEMQQMVENRYHDYAKRGFLLEQHILDMIAPFFDKLRLSPAVKSFVQKSKQHHQRLVRRNRLIKAGLLIIAFLVLSVFTFWNLVERQKAEKSFHLAQVEKNHAQQSLIQAEKNYKEAEFNLSQALTLKASLAASEKDWQLAKLYSSAAILKQASIQKFKNVDTEIQPGKLQNWGLRKVIVTKQHEYGLKVALSADGNVGAYAGQDSSVVLIKNVFQGGKEEQQYPLNGHTNDTTCLDFSHDGSLLASASKDRTVRIWNVRSHKCLYTLKDFEHDLDEIAFHPLEKLLLIVRIADTLTMWDIQHAYRIFTVQAPERSITSMACHPKKELLVVGNTGGSVWLCDLVTGFWGRKIMVHTEPVNVVQFSPHGQILATGSDDETVKLWDAETFSVLRTLKNFSSPVVTLSFSTDNKMLVAICSEGIINIWHVESGEIFKTLPDLVKLLQKFYKIKGIDSMQFSRTDTGILCGGREIYCQLRFRKIESREDIVASLKHVPVNSVHSMAWSPTANLLAVAQRDNTITLYDTDKANDVSSLTGHGDDILSLKFSPDGTLLASGSSDFSVRLWNLHEQQCVAVFPGHSDSVTALAFNPKGDLLTSGSLDGTVNLWHVTQRRRKSNFVVGKDAITTIALSNNGKLIAAGGDKIIKILNMSTGRCEATLKGQEGVTTVAFNADDTLLVSTGLDKTIKLWDYRKRKALTTLEGHTDSIIQGCFQPLTNLFLSISADKTVRFWDINTRQCIALNTYHNDKMEALAFEPAGTQFAVAGKDKKITIWQKLPGLLRADFKHDFSSPNYQTHSSLDISEDERIMAIQYRYGVLLWDMKQEETVMMIKEKDDSPLEGVTISPDQTIIVSQSINKEMLKMWDFKTGEYLGPIADNYPEESLMVFNPSGTALALSKKEKCISLWNVKQKKIEAVLEGHADEIKCMTFSADGKFLFSGSLDKTIRIWDAVKRTCIANLTGHDDTVTALARTSEGNIIISGSLDKTIRVWDTQKKQCIARKQAYNHEIDTLELALFDTVLVSIGDENIMKLWHFPALELISTITVPDGYRATAFSPQGNLIAFGSDTTIKLVHLPSGQCISEFNTSMDVSALKFNPDQSALIAADTIGGVKIWNLHYLWFNLEYPYKPDQAQKLMHQVEQETGFTLEGINAQRMRDVEG
ncbi:hypothetical protein ACFL27_08945 [candidate division CSSED10-310 bacterium]|uniref:Novel STAND NTPase 1 domain-containing protein n=1 Tax=candidate division CSSED10-310 bacterium TaxID=2855610 RepID=A0ABV6YW66_UNCC1